MLLKNSNNSNKCKIKETTIACFLNFFYKSTKTLSKTKIFFSLRAIFVAFLRFFCKVIFVSKFELWIYSFLTCLYVFYIVIVLYFKFYSVSCASCLANELKAWLLYYSLPWLSGILQQPFLYYFVHLVEAIHLFIGTVISPNDISKEKECITYFYKEFGLLYGMIFFIRLFLFKM